VNLDDDLEEELRSHIEHRADDLERSGLDRVAAVARGVGLHERSGPPRLRLEACPSDAAHQLFIVTRGSVFAARRAGTANASAEVSIKTPTAFARTEGSHERTP
jgi:hypothetical protein